jgi:hypothetical protein
MFQAISQLQQQQGTITVILSYLFPYFLQLHRTPPASSRPSLIETAHDQIGMLCAILVETLDLSSGG